LIKTLFKKIVHNKNDIFPTSAAIPVLAPNTPPNLMKGGSFMPKLTYRADFLQEPWRRPPDEKGENVGLQIEYKVVYNQPIAVTPA
jgi:hypothetical protein